MPLNAFGAETLLASYTRDALGRVLSEQQYDPDGATVVRSRYAIAYDNRNRVLSESATQRRGPESYTSYSTSWYSPDGTLASSAVQSWKDGGAETTNATTTYKYIWRDGPLTSAVTLSNKDGSTQSLYTYDDAGRLTEVKLTGGLRPRRVQFTTDLGGQVLTRDEVPQYTPAPAYNPHARRYYFEGVEMGQVGNDGTDDTTMADAVARGRVGLSRRNLRMVRIGRLRPELLPPAAATLRSAHCLGSRPYPFLEPRLAGGEATP